MLSRKWNLSHAHSKELQEGTAPTPTRSWLALAWFLVGSISMGDPRREKAFLLARRSSGGEMAQNATQTQQEGAAFAADFHIQ